MNQRSDETRRAPYVSFMTFEKHIRQMHDDNFVPHVFDRTVWPKSYSGATISHLKLAYAYLGLLGENDEATEELQQLAKADEANRAEVLNRIFRRAYSPLLTDLDLTRATLGQIQDALGAKGAVGKKTVSFFLNLAAAANVQLNPMLDQSGRTKRGRPPRRTTSSSRPAKTKAGIATVRESSSVRSGGGVDWIKTPPQLDPCWSMEAMEKYFELVRAWKALQKQLEQDEEK